MQHSHQYTNLQTCTAVVITTETLTTYRPDGREYMRHIHTCTHCFCGHFAGERVLASHLPFLPPSVFQPVPYLWTRYGLIQNVTITPIHWSVNGKSCKLCDTSVDLKMASKVTSVIQKMYGIFEISMLTHSCSDRTDRWTKCTIYSSKAITSMFQQTVTPEQHAGCMQLLSLHNQKLL